MRAAAMSAALLALFGGGALAAASDFCSASDATEPIDLTLRGAFGSTSPGTL